MLCCFAEGRQQDAASRKMSPLRTPKRALPIFPRLGFSAPGDVVLPGMRQNPMSENDAERGAKLRKFLRRRRAANAGTAPAGRGAAGIGGNRPGGGAILRMILEKRARNDNGTAGQAGSSDSSEVGQLSPQEIQLLTELRTRVEQLTEELSGCAHRLAGPTRQRPKQGKAADAARSPAQEHPSSRGLGRKSMNSDAVSQASTDECYFLEVDGKPKSGSYRIFGRR